MVITDHARIQPEALLCRVERVCALARPGSVVVQLRDRDLPVRERLLIGTALRGLVAQFGQALSVNDRVDLALALRARALHLGEASLPVAEARALAPDLWISRACHDPDAVEPGGADAVLLSPIVEPRKGQAALGFAALSRARPAAGRAHLIALGGITAGSARACLEAGADAVAAIGSVLDVEDPTPLLSAIGALR
jgi:thiamine-phosphate pyrophosphorylase